ncbi:MAG TPA: CHRD domain-containing protein [Actinomycetota bacterium]|nr:CHRD domain-containing protein [Actinomycetota bacterium]
MSVKGIYRLVAIVLTATLLTACNAADETTTAVSPQATQTPGDATPATPPPDGEAILNVELAAENEVPQAGDREMSGSGTVRINPGLGEVCPEIEIDKPEATSIRAAHIHRGPAGSNGPVVVPFESDASGIRDECVTAELSLLNEIQRDPAGFYVNVHTEQYPDGAIRGQLSG